MRFNLKYLRLGDLLLLAPALREGDTVAIDKQHRLTELPVHYTDKELGLKASAKFGQHSTDSWLEKTGRLPIRHKIREECSRKGIVIAPDVRSYHKKWDKWNCLISFLPEATVIDNSYSRKQWVDTLNSAHTVICPDTGTVHMADALGVPKVIGLYSGGFDIYAPYWNREYCIVKPSMEAITVQEVMDKIYE